MSWEYSSDYHTSPINSPQIQFGRVSDQEKVVFGNMKMQLRSIMKICEKLFAKVRYHLKFLDGTILCGSYKNNKRNINGSRRSVCYTYATRGSQGVVERLSMKISRFKIRTLKDPPAEVVVKDEPAER